MLFRDYRLSGRLLQFLLGMERGRACRRKRPNWRRCDRRCRNGRITSTFWRSTWVSWPAGIGKLSRQCSRSVMGRNTWRARDCGRYNRVQSTLACISQQCQCQYGTPTTYGPTATLVVVESPRENKSLTCAKRANPFLRLRCLSRTVPFTTTTTRIDTFYSSPSSLHLLLTVLYCLGCFYPHPPLFSIVLSSTASPFPSGIRPPTIDPRFRLNRSVTSCTFDTSLFLNPRLHQRLSQSFRGGEEIVLPAFIDTSETMPPASPRSAS